ncbi:MFS transporter [Methanosarcina mazei]|uniref:Macrolide transporter n=1 Tax=Methanosarcina mazei TaxID=2209 RepID=A0A0F8EF07_METMZ|nr:MFS transporter [Methanosarcina mazei]KKG06565.1 macrolide transporter [Methanosarcina mazei]KKH66007.1 macrolide transporter [Methanosarcina mazei]UWJ24508.1 Macrolide-efflux protein [Methanosarcina mazei TMA]BBL65194.1 MFS transporter [Methanosarcina mazei]
MTNNSTDHYSKFLLIWFGQFISIIGSGLTIFSLGVYVYQQTGTASSYVFILMCAFLPPFLLKPYGGILADRHDRRLMMVIGDSGSTLGLLFIFIMMLKGNIELWQIYLGIAISSTFSAFQEPAYKALITDLLPENQYAKASGLVQLASSAQYLISPFLAGIILTIMDIKFVFLIDVATFLIASSIVIWIRNILGITQITKPEQNNMADLKEGIQEFSKNRGVVNLVITTMFVLFFVGLLQSLIIPMLLNLTTVKAAGITQSICASGILIGSLFIGVFGNKNKYVKTLSISLFISGIFFANLGFSTNIAFVTLAGFLFFATLPFINTSIEVLIRRNIDNSKQGRVWSIISMVTYLGSIIAFAVAGFLADKIFNPLLEPEGLLSETAGSIIGVGEGRGIALMFIISGLMISIIALLIWKNQTAGGHPTLKDGVCFGPPARLLGDR